MNFLEPGLAFVEGLALIASPCILPVLPLVLSASVEGGRKRPFGIILGFVLSFTLFALASRKLVAAFHVDLDLIKYGSLILLAAFGLVLLSEKLSARFSALTQRFANAGTTLTASAQGGFGSGVLIGLLIGLVWTPCAGPILAAVLVQVIRQQNDLAGTLIIGAFALGAGIPMLLIALTGRRIMGRLGFLTQHAEAVRKGFGVLILLSVAFIASGIDIQTVFAPKEEPLTTAQPAPIGLQRGLETPYPAPKFAGLQGWLNSEPQTMAALKGKVVLVDFWTYSCINCVRTLPYLTKWDEKYRDQGLVIVGIHSPEFEFEKKQANVAAALAQHGIRYPVALDNALSTWTAFKNRYWPAHYLIDREGRVVYTHFGEGAYGVTENNIRFLLGLKPVAEAAPAPQTRATITPETYLGHARAQHYAGSALQKDTAADYIFPSELKPDQWALEGGWKVEGQKITATKPGAALRLRFTAKRVFLVVGTANDMPASATLTLNGQPLTHAGKDAPGGTLKVEKPRLVELVAQDGISEGLLEIQADTAGLEAYAFTFGRQ